MAMNPFDESPSSGVPAAVVSKVNGPAIGLLVTGILNVLLSLYIGFTGLVFWTQGPQIMQQNPGFDQMQRDMEAQGVDPAQAMKTLEAMGPLWIVFAVVVLIVGVIIILGALKMKKLQSHGLAMTASILAMVPCLSACCPGLPIGIWALIVLNNPEVKAAFR